MLDEASSWVRPKLAEGWFWPQGSWGCLKPGRPPSLHTAKSQSAVTLNQRPLLNILAP